MSNGKNTSRMSYTTGHPDDLTTLNSGDATLTALQFSFSSLCFSRIGMKTVFKEHSRRV